MVRCSVGVGTIASVPSVISTPCLGTIIFACTAQKVHVPLQQLERWCIKKNNNLNCFTCNYLSVVVKNSIQKNQLN